MMGVDTKIVRGSMVLGALACAALAGCAETPGDRVGGMPWRLGPAEQDLMCAVQIVRDSYPQRSDLRRELGRLWCRVEAASEEEEPLEEQVCRRDDADTSAMVKRAVLGAGTYPAYVRELTATIDRKAFDLAVDCPVLRHEVREVELLLRLQGDRDDSAD